MANANIPTNDPLYWRAETVARLIGVNKKLLISDAAHGRLPVPVRLARFGASGITFVRVEDARALVQALNNPEGNNL